MVTGNRVGPLSQKSDYLLKKIKAIENTTGIQFGAAYRELLKEGAVISNSEPPSIAFNVFKSFRPDLRFQLAHSIQNLHFQMGKDLNQMKCYFDVCEQFGINKFGFMDRYQDPAYQQLTVSIFEQVKEWGIQHFPVLMLEKSEGRVRIQEGYSTFEDLDRSFSGVLGK